MTRQFKRNLEVGVGQGVPGAGLPIGWTELEAQFQIVRTAQRAPSKCTCTLFNLNKTSRRLFTQDRAYLVIKASYDDIPPGIVFIGDITKVEQSRDGEATKTTITAHDGRRAFQRARMNKSYAPGTPNLILLQDAVLAMGLPLGHIASIPVVEYLGGYAAVGQAHKILDDVTESVQATYSIQNGQLQILAKDEGTNEVAWVIGPQTGLVGSPERLKGAGQTAARKSGIRVKMLMNSQVTPGRYILVRSEDVNGYYLVKKVTHTGDIDGDVWQTEAEAVEVQAAPTVGSVLALVPGFQAAADWWSELVS